MRKICLVAGGTGGHIFPAIAFGEWMTKHREEVSVSYVCGSRALEHEIFSSAGLAPVFLPLSGSPFGVRNFAGKMRRWKEIFTSFFAFRRYLKENRLHCCVLFGGYVSFIPLILCHLFRIPLIVHEQNSVAGKVTRLSVKFGKKVASGWNVCTPLSSGSFIRTGVPVRRFVLKGKQEAFKEMGLEPISPKERIIGVLGGSLMSQRLIQLLGTIFQDQELDNVTFLIPSDSQSLVPMQAERKNLRKFIFIEKQWDMSCFYSVVEAVVTRGGASTLAELISLGIPAVIVPWRDAADNHQEMNARCFLENNDGELWREDESPEALRDYILRILRKKRHMKENFSEGDESESLWRLISSSTGREII
jgi:UDP-N-acetylglucosamine--N-acetylmuramyl-(pentapeptide) pyrophosphoryl-undecaprenol N-acetylglucosamine transferase